MTSLPEGGAEGTEAEGVTTAEYSFRHARRLACHLPPGGRSKTTRRIKSNMPHKEEPLPGERGGYESDCRPKRLVTFVQPLPGRGTTEHTASAPKATRGGPAQRSGPIHTRINDPRTRIPPLDTERPYLSCREPRFCGAKALLLATFPLPGGGLKDTTARSD